MANQSVFVFKRLSNWYLLALTAIAVVLLISHGLIQSYLDKQLNDSRIVNVAGRQRMLSQKLSKEVLKLAAYPPSVEKAALCVQLSQTLDLWVHSHEGLRNGDQELDLPGGNSEEVTQMFEEIEPHFDAMVNASRQLLRYMQDEEVLQKDSVQQAKGIVLAHEEDFLKRMDELVFQYDAEAKNKVLSLRQIEYFLLAFAIGTLLLELVFIFRPTASYVSNIVQNLLKAEALAIKNTDEITQLYQAKEESILELKALNFALNQASLFASTTLDGTLVYISEKLARFLDYKDQKPEGFFAEILSSKEGEQEYIASLIRTPRSSMWNGEITATTRKGRVVWLELAIVPVNRSGVKQDYLILCNDITMRKQTEAQLQKLNQNKFEEEIRLQRIRSLQVLEAQENERKRIARDIHDGIGQMLTALKFNLESLNAAQHPIEQTEEKIERLKLLSAKLIKGVRIATFNLTPPELTDYGISTALAKLSTELKKLTSENILFVNKTQYAGRLSPVVETNLYRVIQEGVNNAIKYAKASYILITVAHSKNLLSFVVEDDGIGFEDSEIEAKESSENGSNMGLSFIRERVSYINGRMFIRSEKGKGTRITINLPL